MSSMTSAAASAPGSGAPQAVPAPVTPAAAGAVSGHCTLSPAAAGVWVWEGAGARDRVR